MLLKSMLSEVVSREIAANDVKAWEEFMVPDIAKTAENVTNGATKDAKFANGISVLSESIGYTCLTIDIHPRYQYSERFRKLQLMNSKVLDTLR